ncbi:MAG TPA: hypothetical protein VMT45_10435 [Thermoanaerobaculaceae bacterium]|nr:hypothetical protein [Thermoanaerobaculaceae bacterium]
MATAANLEEHCPALTEHDYRMLGSAIETRALTAAVGPPRELPS